MDFDKWAWTWTNEYGDRCEQMDIDIGVQRSMYKWKSK